MKNFRWLLIGAVLLLLAVGGWFYWRTTKTPDEATAGLQPQLRVLAVDVSDISEDNISLTARLYLSNPYPFELRTRRLDYQIFIDSTRILESAYDEALTIKSGDSTVVKLPMDIKSKEAGRVIKGITARGQDSANYTIKASVVVDLPVVGEKVFDWEKTKRLPTYQIPTLKIDKINIEKFSFKNPELEVLIHFYNPNVFDLEVKDFRYELTVGKQDNLQAVGSRAGLTRIPKKSSTIIPVQIRAEIKQGGKLIGQALFNKSETPVQLLVTLHSASEKEFNKGSKIVAKITGTLDEFTGKKK
ncbi:MAG: LEA type 2 family protein [Sphingobacteriaceae bacterium]|nr:LEA type 2 family protein [Cytophagaceae bacterium]